MPAKSLQSVSIAAAEEARQRIEPIVLRTPLLRLDIDTGPAEIWLKLENLQPIRSFKLRGAANAMLSIDRSELRRGVWTASAGNMAQGVAWCARYLGVDCSAVVPEGAPEAKLAAIRALGADIVPVPYLDWFQIYATREYPGMRGTFVHAFDDDAVMAGNSTIALEILEDLPDVDSAVIPYGGGGLFCGVGAVLRQHRPEARLYAAEVSTAAPLAAAVDAGKPVHIDHQRSFVDGIGGPLLFEQMWERTRPMLEGSLRSNPDEIADAIRLLVRQRAIVAEGAGAAPVAAAIAGRAGTGRIVCIVSGGNIDADALRTILANETP